jgi:hypothetical protein
MNRTAKSIAECRSLDKDRRIFLRAVVGEVDRGLGGWSIHLNSKVYFGIIFRLSKIAFVMLVGVLMCGTRLVTHGVV